MTRDLSVLHLLLSLPKRLLQIKNDFPKTPCYSFCHTPRITDAECRVSYLPLPDAQKPDNLGFHPP